MSVHSAAIIELATPITSCDSPARVRNRLEWTWGLGRDHLDGHLREFYDPQSLLTDETVLVFPHNDIIRQLSSRDNTSMTGVRRPYIQKLYHGCKSFEYVVLPTDPISAIPPRFLTSDLPPHLILCTTYGKMQKAWGKLPGDVWNANLVSIIDRAKEMPNTNGRPALGMWHLTQMDNIHSKWTWADYVPPSFLSAESDQTSNEEHRNTKRKSTNSNYQLCHSTQRSITLSSSAIIDLATPLTRLDPPARIRARLEWTWGLGHDHLDEHLLEFDDPINMLTDETILLYDGLKTFEYLIVSADAEGLPAPRILTSELPPHLVLCTTHGKMLKAWGKLPRKVWDANRAAVVKRAKAVPQNGWPALDIWQLTLMQQTHRRWTWAEYVPPSFLFADPDQTMVEPEEERTNPKRKSGSSDFAASSSSGSRYEPKRRLLPSEFESPPLFVVRMLAAEKNRDDSDDDDAISNDSHISGVEGDPEAFAKASAARGDYEVDPKRLKGIRRWAKRASRADVDETLLNDEQIKDDSQERPRDVASLDLGRPDYLLRNTGRTAL
ncbi:hypothetical protein MSAN_02112700 [Mycena sanguinolenta]|uniref:Uncharacterized protein n=1 Tax=Mycena sanguinolenta TaxID=230812 RepID=A0A8H6XG44_9AGAR|nr:hypothetical protein MSAN_02112700 [Mycena sanguinolenta]